MLKVVMHEYYINFESDISNIQVPTELNYPFYYEPHELIKIAAMEVQEKIETYNWSHDFGINSLNGIGKMFGILIVKDIDEKLFYLCSHSGKLNDSPNFLIPIINNMELYINEYQEEKEEIHQLTHLIDMNQSITEKEVLKEKLRDFKNTKTNTLKILKAQIKINKEKRDSIRANQIQSDLTEKDLIIESINDRKKYKEVATEWSEKIKKIEDRIESIENQNKELKEKRNKKSYHLHKKLFSKYTLSNFRGENKSLFDIFSSPKTELPPGGAGDCAAPRLLQFAYKNHLTPIAIGEFWWGRPHSSKIRKHKEFYPACTQKCKPILNHMLKGLSVEANPMEINPASNKKMKIIYEDNDLAIISKPSGLLSTPGKNIKDSVQTRCELSYTDNTGPFIIHRLDQCTSGLMIIAKNKSSHAFIQKQFLKRTIKKEYIALLYGKIEKKSGEIDLPLIGDIENLPNQKVCFDYGKKSITHFEFIKYIGNNSLVSLFPKTGRTHQLRVHMAHEKGLNHPIIGDDLYGVKANRLHLHARKIEFIHPRTKEIVIFIDDDYFIS